MTTYWDPASVSTELLELTHFLGDPQHDLAILAEGNTSEIVGDTTIVVKTSGSHLDGATPADFVTVDVDEVMSVVDDPAATQADLTAVLVASDARSADGTPKRASIETVLHAATARLARTVGGCRFVGHTHPTDVVGVLASVHAEHAWDSLVYSDEAVVVGLPVYVPYESPGIELGRRFDSVLHDYVDEHGSLPQLVLLGNHGIAAIAPSAAGVQAISLMAVKGARVRATALAAGGMVPLSVAHVQQFFRREDVSERRTKMAMGG